jgi:hypothetical protein
MWLPTGVAGNTGARVLAQVALGAQHGGRAPLGLAVRAYEDRKCRLCGSDGVESL